MRVLDVDGGSETSRVFGDVVAEDDGPHGRLAGAGFALEDVSAVACRETVHGGRGNVP